MTPEEIAERLARTPVATWRMLPSYVLEHVWSEIGFLLEEARKRMEKSDTR